MPFHTQRLLIVDDLPDNRAVLARPLIRRGFQVAEAAGGSSALALLESDRFDAVLLDVVMPGINGMEVLRRIRADLSPAQLPVVMVSALTEGALIQEALNLGANDYITKPIDFPVSLPRILRAVSSRSILAAA